jgi:hypothetical protein
MLQPHLLPLSRERGQAVIYQISDSSVLSYRFLLLSIFPFIYIFCNVSHTKGEYKHINTQKIFEYFTQAFWLTNYVASLTYSVKQLRLSVSHVTQSVWYLAMDWRTGWLRFNFRQRQEIFPLTSVSRLPLGPIQSPVQSEPEVLLPGVKRGQDMTLTTHPHLVPR